MEGTISILMRPRSMNVFSQFRYSRRGGSPCCSHPLEHSLLLVKLLGKAAISRQLMRSEMN